MTKYVKVVKDFHPYPAGRYIDDGPGNGTSFRETFLVPNLLEGETVVVDLDGAPGYPSSFLEEAFGGLIRANLTPAMIREKLSFTAQDPGFSRYVSKIWAHIERAAQAKAGANAH